MAEVQMIGPWLLKMGGLEYFDHKRRRLDREGYVYVVEAVGADRFKIGYSSQFPNGRLRELRTASPFELTLRCHLRGSRKLEAFLHCAFRETHAIGEWFARSMELDELVRSVASTGYLP